MNDSSRLKKPIEKGFPAELLNAISEKETHAKEKHRPLYFIHKWWARRPGSVFRTVLLYSLVDASTKVRDRKQQQWRAINKEELENPWLLFSEDVDVGKIVMDPMMGGGTTVIEALRLNCKVFGVDVNPVAHLLVENMTRLVNVDEIKQAGQLLASLVEPQLKSWYRTRCPSCGSGDAGAMYYFWIKVLNCPSCRGDIPLFRGYMVAEARDKSGYHVYCPGCSCIFKTASMDDGMTCPSCGHAFDAESNIACTSCGSKEHVKSFNVKDGQSCSTCNAKKGRVVPTKHMIGKHAFCLAPSCRWSGEIVDTIKHQGKPRDVLYGVEYYCPSCGVKSYKAADAHDKQLYAEAERALARVDVSWSGRYFPSTPVPPGEKTREAINHGYRSWRDMFNARQLLCLGTLFKAILDLKIARGVKDLFLLKFSGFLEYQNMLCEYHRKKNHVYNLFKMHAFHGPPNPVENNVWGEEYGLGVFRTQVTSLVKAKQYNTSPFERIIGNDGEPRVIEMSNRIQGRFGDIFDAANLISLEAGKEPNLMLSCKDSRHLDVPDAAVDAVITDPPYYGNVMYSELANFFYAWLRLGFKDRYDGFKPENFVGGAEIIVNRSQDKDYEHFVGGLQKIFSESNRVLKDTGLLVFTFHHKDEIAWGAMLDALLHAGFYITAMHPVLSEKTTSVHIINKKNPVHDAVVVCRKRSATPTTVTWDEIESAVLGMLDGELAKLYQGGGKGTLADEDVFIFLIGKCLQFYSIHYPEVYRDGEKVDIQGVLRGLKGIKARFIATARDARDQGTSC